ncbi:hypothetical protein BBBOND_0313730 [Babesia bigemina]|uniref:Ribosome-binding protein 1 n=1 Tax=Babesia bigemina TaxID=5866 RepID=A0A061D9U2_BABBI|nr:hypothetical protein BBBOND_0313730 [Babesia bigemina]CDR97471.1 hypothetical protein BBBOND_0313730 [Babesia bigemina]|eukprot:XP_012769657.1 hypothetical protein BBBOND_0313730 [Babesia bigemina]
MAAINLNTLKECLQFLEWLKGRKWADLRTRLAGRLARLLDKKYEGVDHKQIESSLSIFLGHVSTFHHKLCNRAGQSNINRFTAKDALEALLQCIPKLLSVIYFLQYHVDKRFSKVGGGDWEGEQVGRIAWFSTYGPDFVKRMKSSAGPIDKYLIESSGSEYGVIPGGFDASDLKQLGHGGYSEGRLMTKDLVNIFDKDVNRNNLFRDVFVTSAVSKNPSVEKANIANALRLVEDFCGIFKNSKNAEDFKSHLESRGSCINWDDLKQHCSTLKDKFSKLFTNNRFSFTGYGRTYEFLDKSMDKKMAKWLKNNLNAMRNQLGGVGGRLDVKTFVDTYLIPYGFTFNGYKVGTGRDNYQALKKDWDAVIGELKKDNGGLQKLKQLLDGTLCPNRKKDKQPKTDSEPKPGPELIDEDDDEDEDEDEEEPWDDNLVYEDTGLEAENAAPIKPKAEAPPAKVPEIKKSDGTPNQGKKVEGAQNQGKKAEGAQNQGKKAEGDTSQNGQSEAKSPSSRVSQVVQTQPSSNSSADSEPPGAPGPGSGQGPGDQAATSGASQQSGREGQTSSGGDAISSTNDGVGGGGMDGWKAGIGVHAPPDQKITQTCPLGLTQKVENGKTHCYPPNHKRITPNYEFNYTADQLWNNYIKREYSPKSPTNLQTKHYSIGGSQPSHTAPAPSGQNTGGRNGHRRDYYEPEWRHRQQGSDLPPSVPLLAPLDGHPVIESTPDPNEKDREDKFLKATQDILGDHITRKEKWDEKQQQDNEKIKQDREAAENKYKSEARTQEIIQRIQERNEKRKQTAQDLDKRYEKTREEIWEIQKQKNLAYIETGADEDTQTRLQQERSEQNKTSEQQNISAYPPTFTPSTIPRQPSRPAPAPSGQNTGGRNSNGRGYYELGEWRPRHEVSSATNMLPSDFIAFAIPDTSSKRLEKEKQKRAESDKQRLKLRRQTEEKKFSDKQQEAWMKEAVELEKADDRLKQGLRDHLLTGGQLKNPNADFVLVSGAPIEPPQSVLLEGMVLKDNSNPTAKWQHDAYKQYFARYPEVMGTIIPAPMTERAPHLSPLDAMPTGNPIIHPKSSSASAFRNTQADKPSMTPNRMHPTGIAARQNKHSVLAYAPLSPTTESIDDLSTARFLSVSGRSLTKSSKADAKAPVLQEIDPPVPQSMFVGSPVPDAELPSSPIPRATFLTEPQPTMGFQIEFPKRTVRKVEPEIGLSIEVAHHGDRTFNDVDLDDPYANTADILKDELKPSDDKVSSGLPKNNFDLDFAPERIGLEGYDDPGMPRDTPRKADERVINPFSTNECLNPWSVDTSTTDIITPPASPPPLTDHLPPPRTVREMLYWLVGFNQLGYIGVITENVNSLFKDLKSDAIEVTGDPITLTASMVTTKLTEACLYSATVIYKIKHNNDFEAFATFDFKSVYSQFRYSTDPAGLLCQLRDYVYACHHQLGFLKSQCSRNELHGGWQDCKYGSDITASNSPLQAFLTDDWDSTFETHPFDPCNLCLNSRVRMGFRDEDLPSSQQTGNTLSSILTPSCGGEGHDALLGTKW